MITTPEPLRSELRPLTRLIAVWLIPTNASGH